MGVSLTPAAGFCAWGLPAALWYSSHQWEAEAGGGQQSLFSAGVWHQPRRPSSSTKHPRSPLGSLVRKAASTLSCLPPPWPHQQLPPKKHPQTHHTLVLAFTSPTLHSGDRLHWCRREKMPALPSWKSWRSGLGGRRAAGGPGRGASTGDQGQRAGPPPALQLPEQVPRSFKSGVAGPALPLGTHHKPPGTLRGA